MEQGLSQYTKDLLLENATTFAERKNINSIVGEAASKIDNLLVDKLYDSVANKSHINFGDIPKSKGDITKYSGYKSMLEVLDAIDGLAKASDATVQETGIIRLAIENIKALKEPFTTGFKLEKRFVQLSYNTLVLGCVDATSGVIAAYINFLKDGNETVVEIKASKDKPYRVAINNLDKFNTSVKKGEFAKALNAINKENGSVKEASFVDASQVNNFIKGVSIPSSVITGSKVIIAIAAIIGTLVLIRDLVFYFYKGRSKISQYLEQQAELLKLNKEVVKNNNRFSEKRKDKIIIKQEKAVKRLMKLSELLKVNAIVAEKESREELSRENKGFTLDDLKSISEDEDGGGFELL